MNRKYGIPYQGSKNAIAEWVVSVLPVSHTLVDLFAGGCAITHAALLNGKYERIIANDITNTPQIFLDAINGEYKYFSYVPTREEFYASDDDAVRLLYSFGNNRSDYLWGDEYAAVKVPASKMISAPSIHERRMHYKTFCVALVDYLKGRDLDEESEKIAGSGNGTIKGLERLQGLQGLEGLERLQGLQGLERLERLQGLQGLEVSAKDYRDVSIPEGATVYADPPYRGTNTSAYDGFDFDVFDEWLASVDFPVYTSEYTAPPGCVEIAKRERATTMAANSTSKRMEKIFVQERFAGDYAPDQTTLDFGEAC